VPHLEEIERRTVDKYQRGTFTSEERIAGYLSGLIADELRGEYSAGSDTVRISVDAYEAPDEPESGVDLGIRYQLSTEAFHVSTGVLVQSKRYGKSDPFLPSQCYKMLMRTQESYVFTYSEHKIGAIPSLPIYFDGGTGGKFTKYYHTGFVDFMDGLLRGYYGDLLIADKIDRPAEAFPLAERVKYLVNIKVAANPDKQDYERNFQWIDSDHYRQHSSEEWF
jgi:hypothetical protein